MQNASQNMFRSALLWEDHLEKETDKNASKTQKS